MLTSFITAVDATKHNKSNLQTHQHSHNNHQNIRNHIRSLIDAFPPSEICEQAALNIGLPSNLLDFKKLSKIIQSESCMPSLTFTLTQLKALYKQCQKLKKLGKKQPHRSQSQSKQITETYHNLYSHSESMNLRPQKREIDFDQKLASALKDQISFRIKVKNFYSTDKIQKKDTYLKKKAERVKNMNKRAFKIYKNYRDKEREEIELFQLHSLQDLQTKTKTVETEPRLRKKRYVPKLGCDAAATKTSDFDKGESDYKRYNTAQTGRRAEISILKKENQYLQNKENNERFDEMRRKQLKTRQKKREIETAKEQSAIFKLIKKQEKLNEITAEHQKKMLEKLKRNKDKRRQSLLKQFSIVNDKPQEQKADLQEQIKSRCEQKTFKKELFLQQKVNRIKEQLVAKEQRMTKHRDNIERQHQNNLHFNEQYLKTYNQKIRRVKQQSDLKQQSTIRTRVERGKQRQKNQSLMHSIAKMSQLQINRHLQKLSNRQQLQSQSFIHTK